MTSPTNVMPAQADIQFAFEKFAYDLDETREIIRKPFNVDMTKPLNSDLVQRARVFVLEVNP
jgi:hypothetical protein